MKILLFFLILLVVVILYSLIENRYIKTAHYFLKMDPDGSVSDVSKCTSALFSGPVLSIVQLSDLHSCRYGKNNAVLLQKICDCKPDIIIMTGDMKNKYRSVPEDMYLFYEKLAKLCPCIYSMGNHELKDKKMNPQSFHEYVKRLQDCGIMISDNEVHPLPVKGIRCSFASCSSSLNRFTRWKTSERTEDVTIPEVNVDESELNILLSHDPELTKEYCASDYSFIFSGHLHGGIVRVPGYRGIISTRFELFPRYDGGCYSLDKKHMLIVSRGLGTHTIKFRLFNRPEIVHTWIQYNK